MPKPIEILLVSLAAGSLFGCIILGCAHRFFGWKDTLPDPEDLPEPPVALPQHTAGKMFGALAFRDQVRVLMSRDHPP